jgi:Zn-dependent protease with chaperone function
VTYLTHGITLALAWFFVVNAVASAAVAFAVRRVPRSASLLFGLRLFPAAISAAFVAAVFLPSYWRFEPRDFTEGFDLTLTALAGVAAVLIAAALGRGGAAWWRAARRARAWTDTAVPLQLADVEIPVFRIDAAQPLLALAGILHPRLIVTRGLMEALTAEELAASVAHEIGHHSARDNLKRLAMRGAPDVLRWLPAARALERAWAAAAEHDADAAASIARSRAMRLALASALVKVARLMPAAAPPAEPISTLVGGGDIASRVQRLIDDAPGIGSSRHGARWFAVAAASAVSLAAGYGPLLEAVHRATETLVHSLP